MRHMKTIKINNINSIISLKRLTCKEYVDELQNLYTSLRDQSQ